MPARFPLAPFTKGLSTLVDPTAGDPQASPDCVDVRGHLGALTLRKGFRVLDIEPSHIDADTGTAKTRGYLKLDSSNYAYNSSWTQTLGTKWTIRWEMNFATLANFTDATRIALHIKSATYDPVKISLIGVTAGSTCKVRVTIKDNAGNSVVLDSAARTSAQWLAAYTYGSSRYLRIVRDGATCYLYIGGVLEDSDTGFTTNAHETATKIYIAADDTPANYANIAIYSNLVIVNRVLTEAECYWGIGWPTDADAEQDVLGNWTFTEFDTTPAGSGTEVIDYSSNKKNLSLSALDWQNQTHTSARGLGIRSWRRSNGDIYHIIACGMRGNTAGGSRPSGAVYTWKATQNFTPFYFGGDPGNDDATAGLTGLNLFARMDFAQGRDMVILSNGKDHARKYRSAYQYLGGTAPATGPVVVTSNGSGISATWLYAYSYYNSTDGTETGLSPTTSITITDDVGCSVTWFPTTDAQFDKVKIYRSKNGETALYLVTEQAMGTGGPYADTRTDAQLTSGPLAPGSDIPGNRARKRAYLAFPDFSVEDTASNTTTTTTSTDAGARRPPTVGPTLAESNTAQGALTLTNTYYVAYSYYDSTRGLETGLSPATAITLTGVNDTIDVSAMILPPEGSRYDKIRVYRTKGNLTTWFLEQTITAAATATITQADSALATTLATYALPPKFQYLAMFANRLWGVVGPTLYWSTAGYYEDFPEANGLAPKAGVRITGISPTEGGMFVHFEDGTVFFMPPPGPEPDLIYFLTYNLRQWSPRGAAVGHYTVQAVPGGLIWLSRDGFYFANPSTLTHISKGIAPEFLDLNSSRGRYACSLYDGERQIYRCWLSRGNNRLNEECFVYYLNEGSWWLDSLHADAAGVLYDAKENPHYCFLVENGVLNELDESLNYDGDGSGTLTGTVTSPSMTRFTEIGSYTAPTGGDGGYPIWFVKSDGTMVQRYRLDNAIAIPADVVTFYPSYTGLTSGTWTAYYHGIRGYFKTMILHLGDMRFPKNLYKMFFCVRPESAGTLQVNLAVNEGTMTAVNSDVDLTKPVSQVLSETGNGRCFQFEFYSDPPASTRPWTVKGVELEADVEGTDAV